MAFTGFKYYWGLLGLDSGSYALHYDFNHSGSFVPSVANPLFSGQLSNVGSFFSISGSGDFTGQYIAVQNATGLVSNYWTHIAIIERNTNTDGLFFDSLVSGAIYSGYVMGFNDNNKLFLEYYDNNGPNVVTSTLMLGKKNLIAASKANNLLSFYVYDFNSNQLLSESFSINQKFLTNSTKVNIGAAFNAPTFINDNPLRGYVDEYIYVTEALNPSSLSILVSGFYSAPQYVSGVVSTFGITGITGYQTFFSGITGVTGYSIIQTQSGTDAFGDPNYTYTTGALTGYLLKTSGIAPLTGITYFSTTGDPSNIINIDYSGFAKYFGLDEVTYIKKVDCRDFSFLSASQDLGVTNLNLVSPYDSIQGCFQLDTKYSEDAIQAYLNGISQISTGYSVTGNYYGSGVVLSGDYFIDGFFVNSTGFFAPSDLFFYDAISGSKQRIAVSGLYSGQTLPLSLSGNNLVFFNGKLLVSGFDYQKNSGQFEWIGAPLNGVTGALSCFPLPFNVIAVTGSFPTGQYCIQRNGSQLFLNGQRQILGLDYLENSKLDLIGQSGIFANPLPSIYNNTETYFQ